MLETIGIIIFVIYIAYQYLDNYLNPDKHHTGFPNGSDALAVNKMNSDNRDVRAKIDAKVTALNLENSQKLFYRNGRDIIEMDPSITDPRKQALIMNQTYEGGKKRYTVENGELVDHKYPDYR